MPTFRPDIPPHVAHIIRHFHPELKRGVRAALEALSQDPELGEPLKRELEGLWKYRVRRFRIIYAIDRAARTLRIMAVGHRRQIYEDMAEQYRRVRQKKT